MSAHLRLDGPGPTLPAAGLTADIVPLPEALRAADAWRDLSRHCLTPAVFTDAVMLESASGRIEADDWQVIHLHDSNGRLDGLGVFHDRASAPVVGPRVAEFFWSHYGPRNPPALRYGGVADALITAMASRSAVLKFSYQALDDATSTALKRAAHARGLAVIETDIHERACLDATLGAEDAVGPGLKQRRAGELRRLWRKLQKDQPMTHRVCRKAADVMAALDAFIAIEGASWKGSAGSSLSMKPERVAFARALLGSLAKDGRVRADVLDFGGEPAAVLLTLFSGSTGYLWKIAHSERIAFASPGVQLVRLATMDFLADPAITAVDSLATANHSLMDRLWAGRQRMGHLFIATSPQSNGLAERAARASTLVSGAKDLLKRLKSRLRG